MHTNRLINATSPYLLQHAHNPVDWYEWGSEALAKAVTEDKPILVSIGYSACHWCHVMERESFENEAIAQIMNEYFVCIKVDREERPDIDQIYMEAVQAMNINGGWPLNVFLTPDQKPFYGGTYFPAPAWSKMLQQLNLAFQQRRTEIDKSAEDLRKHLQTSDLDRFAKTTEREFKKSSLDAMAETLAKRFDRTWGGIEKAPKFVMPSVWLFLLRYYYYSTKEEAALEMVKLTLHKMANGALYDPLAGGFSRYSVDAEWFAPHFEKMLYDNAQLLSLYAEAYSLTKEKRFESIILQSCEWLKNEMTHPSGGFYSALDADSEGIEGKFYTWTYDELIDALGNDSLTEHYYQLTAEGNWEHGRNILWKMDDPSPLAKKLGLSFEQFQEQLEKERKILLSVREKRIRPGLDDKILSGWNAMTIIGLTDVYRTLQNEQALAMAKRAMTFLENHLMDQGKLLRSYKNKPGTTEAFLEDYAYLIQAYQKLYEVTFEENYLHQAEQWMNYVIIQFYDTEENFFFYTSNRAEKLISRKKEIFDNVIPSSNSVMARNLLQLGVLLDRNDWKEMSQHMVAHLQTIIESEPVYLSYWGIVLQEWIQGLSEVIIVGNDVQQKRIALQEVFIPFAVFGGTEKSSDLPLLRGRDAKDSTTWIYVCQNKACQLPVQQAFEAIEQLHKK